MLAVRAFCRAKMCQNIDMKIAKQPTPKPTCVKCKGKGWYFVNEWIGHLQGRKDCQCMK
jgi:hypothetical protein